MARIVLIACASKKQDTPAPARDLYTSALFQYAYQYATSLRPDAIYILSALHGLVPASRVLAPYNQTLKRMTVTQRKAWADQVFRDLRTVTDPEKDDFIILAGTAYRAFLTPRLANVTVPLEGMGIGKQLQWLKQQVNP